MKRTLNLIFVDYTVVDKESFEISHIKQTMFGRYKESLLEVPDGKVMLKVDSVTTQDFSYYMPDVLYVNKAVIGGGRSDISKTIPCTRVCVTIANPVNKTFDTRDCIVPDAEKDILGAAASVILQQNEFALMYSVIERMNETFNMSYQEFVSFAQKE